MLRQNFFGSRQLLVCCINFGSCARKGISEYLFYMNKLASRVRSHACEFTGLGLLWSSGSALDSRVEDQGINTALGQVSQKFHLISWPNSDYSAFIAQESGLKHQHLWVYRMILHVEEFPSREICHL